MSHFQEKQKRQMTGIRLDEEAENQPKRRHENSRPAGARPASQQQQRPASAIMASIMGDQLSRANSTTRDGRRSESATSGGRQHKLKQRFTVIRKLGKGTYGKVQLAINKETGQEVAIKTIKKTKIENEQDLERVRREIQIMSSIEHPHIVHIYEVFENKDKIVLIMQYAPGGELYEYVSQSKVLDEHEARRLFRQIATAIYYCHQNKICHRDLKLENILLDEKNNAKLADFGLSNVFDKSRQLKTFCGSPLYASPEIVQGSPYEGPEVDCWSLGVLLYTLVYGAMPFDGSNFKRLVKQISEASYYEPAQRSLASPLISKLLCADPAKRATILDICSDAWVNGLLAPATPAQQSPRLSPSKAGSQHPSLLKVAQDMANLTPVRLDILLALTPRTEPATGPPPVEQQDDPAEPQANKLADTDQRQIIQPAREQADKRMEQLQRVHEQQEQEKAAMISQLGSELTEAADEMRSSSPVASYLVRGPSPAATSPREDAPQQERPSSRGVGGQTGEVEKEATIEEEIEQLEAVTSLRPPAPDQQDVEMAEDAEAPADESLRHAAVPEQAEPPVEIGPQPANPEVVVEPTKEVTRPDEPEQQHEVVEEPHDTPMLVLDSEAPPEVTEPAKETRDEPKPAEPETNVDVEQTDNSEKQAAEREEKEEKVVGEEKAAAAAGEEKPKKIKKRIVVVKKRRKVVKKDENNREEEAREGEQPSAGGIRPEESRADGDATSSRRSATKVTSTGPGMVRIPGTFDQSAAVQPPQPKQTAARRPSALVTDVSQKLMQQAEGQQTAGSNAIEQDLAQLASVKVSDKKSEFERRTSLAAQQSTPVTPSGSSPRDSTPQTRPTDPPEVEPECCEAKRERVRVARHETPGEVEPVELLKPLDIGQLRVSFIKHGGSEPLTPTNLRPPGSSDETATRLSECARLSSDRAEGERSDSVETIKGEGETGADPSEERNRNIRSSLQIDLSGAQAASAAARQDSAVTFQSTGGSVGPAPITRSYKKVTFTKDGTCITETGRIYSTQADDGTVRRVERKSKVTHYPSDDLAAGGGSTGGGGGRSREETSTHEEIVYESAATTGGQGGEFWPRAGANSRAPLERLIMPSSSFYDDHDDHDESRDGRPEEFMYARPSGQLTSSSHFGQPPPMERADSASSCSSGSTDVFDDIFDTWTGAISMFGQRRHNHRPSSDLRNSLVNRAFATGSPLPFGRQHSNLTRRDSGASRRRHHPHRPQSSSGAPPSGFFPQQPPGSASNTATRLRCESVEPTGFDQQPPARRQHRHHRNHGPPSASDAASGYESDVLEEPTFERRSLGSARGRFGSSNLFPRHASEFGHAPFSHPDPFAALEQDLDPGASLFEQMALEHERLRRRFAQQRQQMWKGSTPAGLNEIPEFRPDPMRQQSSSSRSGSGSHWSTRSSERPHQQQPVKRTSVVFQMGGGGGSGSSLSQLRQSTPLDAAPVRRNTVNRAEHLPPRREQQQASPAGQLVRRSTSKTSFVTSQLANIQLSDEPSAHQRSASFLGLKRDTSTSSSSHQPSTSGHQVASNSQLQQHHQQQQQPGSAVSSATATFWADERATPTIGSSGTTGRSQAPLGRPAPHDLAGPDVEANSRIQSWLLQSTGNLSVSSGSKSSTSDATLPSSGRSDTAAYLASSAAQMAPLRRDESTRTTTTSSLSLGDPLNQQHQRARHSTQSRIILGQPDRSHQLPPAAPGRPREKSPMFAPMPARPAVASSTIIVRSSSRQSLSSEQPDGRLAEQLSHKLVAQANELTETIVGADGSRQQRQQAARHATTTSTTSSSAVISSSQKKFAFSTDLNPEPEARGLGDVQQAMERQQQHQRVVESRHETVTSTTRQQVFSQRAMSPGVTTMSAGPTQHESWFGAGAGQAQRATEDDGFDSLGDLESVCSSSLLEQLRARGYRSMINQRMTPSAAPAGQTQTAAATTEQSNVVTTSSTSMTMSSSSETPQIRHHQIQVQQQADVAPQQDRSMMNGVTQGGEEAPNTCGLAPSSQVEGNLQTSQQNLQDQSEPPPSTTTTTSTHEDLNNNETAQAEEDQDEDVREAKANIREYLERMRETEKFLKSMHEEEERFQRQRQELLLFDNLLLSTKLNGIKPTNAHHQYPMGSLDCNNSAGFSPMGGPLRVGGPHSAPIQINHLHTESVHSNAFMAGKITAGMEPTPQMSCFSSDLYRPMASSFTTGLMGGAAASSTLATRTSDPLEPVQPVSVHAYAPPSTRNWQRSKSQLGDQFADYRARNRPLSANLANNPTGGNAYFPSRQRRSLSQVRYSHHHHNPSVLATSGMNQYHPHAASGDQSPPSMTSEYKSSFGPPSLAPDRRQRPSRSPRRATSPLPGGTTTYGNTRRHLLIKADESDEEGEATDLGLGAYRASSYVPRTPPEVGVASGRGIGASRPRSYSSWRRDTTDRADPTSSSPRHRRNSVQATTSSYTKYDRHNKQDLANDSDTPESSPARRKSWAISNDSAAPVTVSAGQQTTNSRLSELEQRLQANKKRREELLMGINSGAPAPTPSAQPAAATRKTSGRVSSDDDEDLDQSFGFERPSRPAARDESNGVQGEGTTRTQQPAAAATARARPSRLESMEARIKRRSYCIRLNSPDRSARSKVSTANGNKCQMEPRTDVGRAREE